MSRIFKRAWKVTLAKTRPLSTLTVDGVTSDIFEETTQTIDKLRVQFRIMKSLEKTPNTLELHITNLSGESRGKLGDPAMRVVVEAGYDKDTAVIFSGAEITVSLRLVRSTSAPLLSGLLSVPAQVEPSLLYSFVSVPAHISTTFLGLVDVSKKSAFIAFIAALSSYLQFKVSSQGQAPAKGTSFGDNLTRSMQSQAKYLFPILMFFIAYKISGVIGLYFVTTNLFSIAQELFVRKNIKRTQTA